MYAPWIISLVLIHHRVITIAGQNIKEESDSFCHPFPGVVFQRDKISIFENGSLMYDNMVYPIGSYRESGNDTYGCICNLRTCLRKCCGSNEILGKGDRPNCTRLFEEKSVPDLVLQRNQLAEEIRGISNINDMFLFVEDVDCPKDILGKYMLEPERYKEDNFVLQANGTLLTLESESHPASSYCLDWKESFEKIAVLVCRSEDSSSIDEDEKEEKKVRSVSVGILISIPFIFLTFFVYAIIPELRNLYGKTLMCYVGCLMLAYSFLASTYQIYFEFVFCSTIAFITHFFFLASFFWLNVMCFDIWWTFGGFRSLQGSMHQRERKKFLIYSIYAWGCASLITGICAIMDFLPIIPDYFVKPEFGHLNCWFKTKMATAIYFYGPMGVTVLCNICLFVSTALKIVKHKRDTAHHLRGVDSRRHDDNKQWFNLYLKLFIVMGINWSMEIISWLFDNSPEYLWYITDLTNTLQGVIIFLIFVCKKKIRRLLLKRYGCQGNNILSRNSTRSGYHSSAASRTCTTSAAAQEKITSICLNEPFRCRPTIDK